MNFLLDSLAQIALAAQESPAGTTATPPAPAAKALQVEGLPSQAAQAGAPATGATIQPGGTPLVPGTGTANGPGARPAPQPDMLSMLWPMFAIIGVFLVVSIMSGRKDKKRRESLMKGLGKGDKVQTIGGILGTVMEVGDDDVLLRVDETSNTRIRFAKAAVQQVLRSASGTNGASTQAEAKPVAIKAGV
jgi:preprotein translocase subunit YajC